MSSKMLFTAAAAPVSTLTSSRLCATSSARELTEAEKQEFCAGDDPVIPPVVNEKPEFSMQKHIKLADTVFHVTALKSKHVGRPVPYAQKLHVPTGFVFIIVGHSVKFYIPK